MTRALWVPERQDIIWINFNPQVGREKRDMHPILVLSPKAFNDKTSIVIGFPMSMALNNDTNPLRLTTANRPSKPVTSFATSPRA